MLSGATVYIFKHNGKEAIEEIEALTNEVIGMLDHRTIWTKNKYDALQSKIKHKSFAEIVDRFVFSDQLQ